MVAREADSVRAWGNGTHAGWADDKRTIRPVSPDPLSNPKLAVEELVERVCHRYGGAKALAGSEVPVGYAQIRRWAGDGGLLGLDDLLLMVRLAGPDDPFRVELARHLGRMFDPTPEQIAAQITERLEAGATVKEAVLETLNVVEVSPGRWVTVR